MRAAAPSRHTFTGKPSKDAPVNRVCEDNGIGRRTEIKAKAHLAALNELAKVWK